MMLGINKKAEKLGHLRKYQFRDRFVSLVLNIRIEPISANVYQFYLSQREQQTQIFNLAGFERTNAFALKRAYNFLYQSYLYF